jgi:hypothetical protein
MRMVVSGFMIQRWPSSRPPENMLVRSLALPSSTMS